MTANDPNRQISPSGDPSDAPTVTWTPPSDRQPEDVAPAAASSERVRAPGGGSRLRWAVALLVTALVVAGGVVAVTLLTGQSAPSKVAGYAPAGSVVYGELRLDLPGDQRQQLGQFLSKFPGFADQSTLDLKIDDVLDRVVRAASDGRQDWTTKIKPWFGGELGVGIGALPQAGDAEDAQALLILSVTDPDRARAWFDEIAADLSRTQTNHQNVPLTVFGEGGKSGAMAIHDGTAMLIGDEVSVRAAIDTGGRSTLATEGPLRDALAAVEGEGLGYMFIDAERYASWLEDAAGSIPGMSAMPMAGLSAELMPDWILFRAQARADALAFEAVMPHVEALSASGENRPSVLAGQVPSSTVVFAEGHELGASIRQWIELARQDPEAADEIAALEQQAALLGGVDGLIGWMGDAALVVAREGDGIAGGVVIQPKDAAAAQRLLGVLRAGLSMVGAQQGVTVRDEDHNGTPITVYDLGEIGALGMLFGGALPPGADMPEGHVELAVASTESVVVLASSPSFARAVLDAGSGSSLADDGRYRDLIGRVGAENVGSSFLDVKAIRELVERLAAEEPEALAAYERDIKPYLLPLDTLVQATVRDGDIDRTTGLIVVK